MRFFSLGALVTEIYEEIYSPRQGQVVIRALVEPNALLLIGRAESGAPCRCRRTSRARRTCR